MKKRTTSETRSACRLARLAITCCLLLSVSVARAGRTTGTAPQLRMENVRLVPRDNKTAIVRFDISWEKSWRNDINHDAAWVFFKVRREGETEWEHVRLAADRVLNPTGYGQQGGALVDLVVPDGEDGLTGMFVRRAELGAPGTLTARNVTALWEFTANKGVTKDVKVRVKGFGIQMVYVAEGPFYLGSGGAEANGFYKYTDGSQSVLPYRVTGPVAIPTGGQEGKLWARQTSHSELPDARPEDGGQIPASFPNGYNAFYCMKNWITDSQYAGFLSTLSAMQAKERYDPTGAHPSGRGPIARSGEAPDYTYSRRGREEQTLWGLSWADGVAFAAWAGLRPMTELEWEKAMRGPREPRPDEVGPPYWGILPGAGWHWPLMHDGTGERAVTVGNAEGRRFAGTHGRGTPALPPDWPQEDAVGAGLRTVARTAASARLSDRLYAAAVEPGRNRNCGQWRGVRTAPAEVGP